MEIRAETPSMEEEGALAQNLNNDAFIIRHQAQITTLRRSNGQGISF